MKAMKQKQQQIREQLTEMERRLLGEVSKALDNVHNASASDPTELLDMVAEGELDYMAALSAQAGSAALEEIELALEKLKEGTYGVCEECGSQIGERRLDVRPFAVLCVRCKERQERLGETGLPGGITVRGGSDVYVNLNEDDLERPDASSSQVLREIEDADVSEMF